MLRIDAEQTVLEGPAGTLPVPRSDEFIRKFAMLYEGECEGLGGTRAARKFGFSRQRYYQLRQALATRGTEALHARKRGPKRRYRRTDEAIRQVIRHRFLDPDASPDVIAQKLRQCRFAISTRSVQRIIQDFGLQKKTPHGTARSARASVRRNASDRDPTTTRTGRRRKH